MIPRDLAESVVRILEHALDSLREAHGLARAIAERTLSADVEPALLATANTGGALAAIYEAYPDLVGMDAPDAAERDAAIAQRPLSPGSVARVRALLDDAYRHLERVASLVDGHPRMEAEDQDPLGPRLGASLSCLRSVLEQLQRHEHTG